MRLAKGPRPWPIWLFGVILLLYGLFNLVSGLMFLEEQQTILERQFPQIVWNEDWTIVWVSAQFTIVVIPITAVCVFASPFAKWLMTAMALVSLPWIASYVQISILSGVVDWVGLVQASVVVVAAGLLFLPASSRYLQRDTERAIEAFE